MSDHLLSSGEVARALAVRDLTDSREGRHAMQQLVDGVVAALTRVWRCDTLVYRGPRIVDVAQNYDVLGYEPDAITRDARYTRYVAPGEMLRSHTSTLVPAALRTIGGNADDVLVACPGIVYRRDAIDCLHTSMPHQLDVWRVCRDRVVTSGDLEEMIEIIVRAVLPGADWRCEPRVHPYTTEGLQVEVENGGEWVEIGECGLAGAHVLRGAGLGDRWSGLAIGLGLDRLLMLRKGIADIRLLRASDPRVAAQMPRSLGVPPGLEPARNGARSLDCSGRGPGCGAARRPCAGGPRPRRRLCRGRDRAVGDSGPRRARGSRANASGFEPGRRTCCCASCSDRSNAR